MFLSLEGERLLSLSSVVALVRKNGKTLVVMENNRILETSFTPQTLRRRLEKTFHLRASFQ